MTSLSAEHRLLRAVQKTEVEEQSFNYSTFLILEMHFFYHLKILQAVIIYLFFIVIMTLK